MTRASRAECSDVSAPRRLRLARLTQTSSMAWISSIHCRVDLIAHLRRVLADWQPADALREPAKDPTEGRAGHRAAQNRQEAHISPGENACRWLSSEGEEAAAFATLPSPSSALPSAALSASSSSSVSARSDGRLVLLAGENHPATRLRRGAAGMRCFSGAERVLRRK